MKKNKYRIFLVLISSLMFLAGCKAHQHATKYGAPPVTKYGVPTTGFMYQQPIPNSTNG